MERSNWRLMECTLESGPLDLSPKTPPAVGVPICHELRPLAGDKWRTLSASTSPHVPFVFKANRHRAQTNRMDGLLRTFTKPSNREVSPAPGRIADRRWSQRGILQFDVGVA